MKRVISFMLSLMMLCGISALADNAADEFIDSVSDIWVLDGFALSISHDEDGFYCSAVGGDGGDVSEVWSFGSCVYDEATGALVCYDCEHRFEHWDEASEELVIEDETMTEGECAVLTLDNETDTLKVTGMPFIDGELTLERLSAAEEADYEEAQMYLGSWACGRALIEVTENDDGSYRFEISWADSAAVQYVWTYDCAYYGEYGEMRSFSGTKRIDTYGEDGEIESSETVYEDGEATFLLDDAHYLNWNDFTEDAGADMAFEETEIIAD